MICFSLKEEYNTVTQTSNRQRHINIYKRFDKFSIHLFNYFVIYAIINYLITIFNAPEMLKWLFMYNGPDMGIEC